MAHCLSYEQLNRWLGGSLSRVEKEMARRHVSQCQRCNLALESLADLIRTETTSEEDSVLDAIDGRKTVDFIYRHLPDRYRIFPCLRDRRFFRHLWLVVWRALCSKRATPF